MRNFWQPEELMRNYIRFRLPRGLSNPHWSNPLKSQSLKSFGLLSPISERPTFRHTSSISLVCLALLFFGTANPLWAQDEPKQDESQQEGEPKQDKDSGKQ